MLGDLQTTAIACDVQSTTCLLDPEHEPLLQHRLNVDWLSSRITYLKSRSSNFLDFRASEILEYDSSMNFMALWKWLKPSADEIDASSSSSSSHFWSALTDFFNLRLSSSRDFIVLEMDYIVFADFVLAEDISLSSSSAAFLQALITLV